MSRGGGMIPPGKAGLVVLAVAAVPIVVKKFRPIVRWTGRKLTQVGERVTKMADEVERYERETAERHAQGSAGPNAQPDASTHPKSEHRKPQETVGTKSPANKPKRIRRRPTANRKRKE